MKMTSAERSAMQNEALDRAKSGQSYTNFPAIYAGFAAKGIAEADIKPRENVFTFNAWKALGRSVKKGEHGVRVVTFKQSSESVRDPTTGETREEARSYPSTSVVFHISQTETTAEREARFAANPSSSARGGNNRGYRGNYRRRDRDYVRDPGEDAADRWNETHY